MEEHDRRLNAAIDEMQAAGMPGRLSPDTRFYRRLGLSWPPMPYAGWVAVVLRMGVPFALITMALDLLLFGSGPNGGWGMVAAKTLTSALLFGGVMALWLRWRWRHAHLSRWEDL